MSVGHRQRKRLPIEPALAPASTPVTRSGKVRRTSGGLVNGDPGPCEQQVWSDEGGDGWECGKENRGGGGGEVCITVDGARSSATANFLRVRLVSCLRDQDGMCDPRRSGVSAPASSQISLSRAFLLDKEAFLL